MQSRAVPPTGSPVYQQMVFSASRSVPWFVHTMVVAMVLILDGNSLNVARV